MKFSLRVSNSSRDKERIFPGELNGTKIAFSLNIENQMQGLKRVQEAIKSFPIYFVEFCAIRVQ